MASVTFDVRFQKDGEMVSANIDFKSIEPALRNTRRIKGVWQIVRTSDGVVIAQSKPPVVAENETPAPVASCYLVINRVIDTEPMECETLDETLTVLYELREDGENLENWLVQEWQGDNLIESRNGRDWYYENVTRHKAGDVVEIMGIQHEVQANGILRQLPPVSKPVSGVRWLRRDDLKVPEHRYFVQQMYPVVLNYELRFADINGHALQAPSTGQIKAKRGSQVCLPNMQRRNAPAPVKVAKREPLRETVMSIVSRIQTPLAPQTERRVA